ncbi:MAG: hypothetical protein AAB840_02750 [Patescibacteria group bacterium]
MRKTSWIFLAFFVIIGAYCANVEAVEPIRVTPEKLKAMTAEQSAVFKQALEGLGGARKGKVQTQSISEDAGWLVTTQNPDSNTTKIVFYFNDAGPEGKGIFVNLKFANGQEVGVGPFMFFGNRQETWAMPVVNADFTNFPWPVMVTGISLDFGKAELGFVNETIWPYGDGQKSPQIAGAYEKDGYVYVKLSEPNGNTEFVLDGWAEPSETFLLDTGEIRLSFGAMYFSGRHNLTARSAKWCDTWPVRMNNTPGKGSTAPANR